MSLRSYTCWMPWETEAEGLSVISFGPGGAAEVFLREEYCDQELMLEGPFDVFVRDEHNEELFKVTVDVEMEIHLDATVFPVIEEKADGPVR